jgi:hypothetical protein
MCMAKTCYVYEVGELSLHKLVQVQDSPTAATGLDSETKHPGVAPLASVEGAKRHDICMKWT